MNEIFFFQTKSSKCNVCFTKTVLSTQTDHISNAAVVSGPSVDSSLLTTRSYVPFKRLTLKDFG